MTELERRLRAEQPPLPAGFETRHDALLSRLTRKEEVLMKKKLSVGLLAALVVVLLALGVAIAASLGVFGQLAQHGMDRRLPALEQLAETYAVETTIPKADEFYPELQFRMTQAHYDGQSLYMAYSLSGPTTTLQFLSPASAANVNWTDTYTKDQLSPDWTETPAVRERLQRDGQVFMQVYYQTLGDGITLPDGTYINPSASDWQRQPDGGYIGYTEYEFPLPEAAQNQDSLTVHFRLHRMTYLYYQSETEPCYRYYHYDRPDALVLPVTISRNGGSRSYTVEGSFPLYAATATATLSNIDVKVDVTIDGPQAWIDAWETDADEKPDHLWGYNLYADGVPCQVISGGLGVPEETKKFIFQYSFALPDSFRELRLRPEFRHSGEHPAEDLVLK